MAGYIGKSQGVVLTDINNNSVTTADIQDGAVTAAKLDTTYATPGYVDTAESDAVTTANAYTDTAISNIDALPDQTGQSGNYLTTDGTTASWGAVDLSSYATTTALNTAVANSSNWDTAYGWGDHSTQNYATTTGDTMTGALNFGDNVKAQFGASQDLQIYHDGSASYVQDTGTGDLRLLGNNLKLANADNTENYLHCTTNGAVQVYYDNNVKLTTTSTGVSITGNLSVSGSIAGAGKVLQVVQAFKDSAFNTTNSSFVTVTGLAPSITPSSTSSKILVLANVTFGSDSGGDQHRQFRMLRGGTLIYAGLGAGSRTRAAFGVYAPNYPVYDSVGNVGIVYLDSPNTTSSVTYSFQCRTNNGGNVYINRTGNDDDSSKQPRTPSSVILLEIAG